MVQGTEETPMMATDTSVLQSPPFGAGILTIALFFFITFFSNVLLSQINLATLGITVTIGTFGILALILLILFLF